MTKILNKSSMTSELPIICNNYIIRERNRDDIDLYAEWPDYPKEYEMFNTSLKNKPKSERDTRWQNSIKNNNSISLAVDYNNTSTIAIFALMDIDWELKSVGNMSIRLHPDFCNQGHGTTFLMLIRDWCLDNDLNRLQFDVLSTNERAIRSYLKAGFEVIKEIKAYNSLFYIMESTGGYIEEL